MKVLIACEFSGKVRNAFTRAGHDAWSCDLLPSLDNSKNHIIGDVLQLLTPEWDLLIAHPPCTYLCNGAQSNITRRPHLGILEKRENIGIPLFMNFVNAPIKSIAIENPIGVMSSRYRKPDQIIRPYMFGHDYNKDVCLWLKNLPKLLPTELIPPPYRKLDFWSTERNKNGYSLKSVTFDGIAQAMAQQWGTL